MNIGTRKLVQSQIKAELEKILTRELTKAGQDVTWLSYAHPHQEGFRVNMNSAQKYALLHRVTNKAVNQYPQITKGTIAHLLSELVLNKRP